MRLESTAKGTRAVVDGCASCPFQREGLHTDMCAVDPLRREPDQQALPVWCPLISTGSILVTVARGRK